MPTNRELLDNLFTENQMDGLQRGPIFATIPPSLPLDLDWDRVEGMLLGLAVGDALGLPTEGVSGWNRRVSYLKPLNYLGKLGTPSDDTQLSYWMLEQMLEDKGFVPSNVACLFRDRGNEIVGIGASYRDHFLPNAAKKDDWSEWAARGPDGLGNGAAMRIAPIILPHLRSQTADLWVDAALCGRLTHNCMTSTASCIGIVNWIWQCLRLKQTPDPNWWLEEFVRVVRPLDSLLYRSPQGKHKPTALIDFQGTLADLIETHVAMAYQEGWSVRDACDPFLACKPDGKGWGSGPFLFETIPSVVFVLMRHGDSFEDAITRAILDTRDNDTIASIVGAVLGALHGKKAIPERWLKGLRGKTRGYGHDDDGAVFRLIDQARSVWG